MVVSSDECFEGNKIITPNDDGKNDYFIITCVLNTDNHLFIFNRTGGLVYETNDYTNNWTGVDNDNQLLPDGGYMWVLEISDATGTPAVHKGVVYLLRTAD
jgi:gliding motility-associated-like protein